MTDQREQVLGRWEKNSREALGTPGHGWTRAALADLRHAYSLLDRERERVRVLWHDQQPLMRLATEAAKKDFGERMDAELRHRSDEEQVWTDERKQAQEIIRELSHQIVEEEQQKVELERDNALLLETLEECQPYLAELRQIPNLQQKVARVLVKHKERAWESFKHREGAEDRQREEQT